MVWTCHEERPGVRRKKGDGNGVTGKKEKREAKEKIFRCSEGSYGKSCGARETDIENRTLWRNGLETYGAVKKHNTLWLPLIKGKGRKKK